MRQRAAARVGGGTSVAHAARLELDGDSLGLDAALVLAADNAEVAVLLWEGGRNAEGDQRWDGRRGWVGTARPRTPQSLRQELRTIQYGVPFSSPQPTMERAWPPR